MFCVRLSEMQVWFAANILLLCMILTGCADFAALRNCENSGEAVYNYIYLASRSEHEQALLFKPANPNNCLIYLVGEKSWFRPDKRRYNALVFIEPKSSNVAYPFGGNLAEINSDVYVMWELPPDTYRLLASKLNELYFESRVEIDCKPGSTHYFSYGRTFFSLFNQINEVSKEDVIEQITNGLRSSVAPDYLERPNKHFKYCPVKKPTP